MQKPSPPGSDHAPKMHETQIRDVIVVGGGPAGLSAALILLRACRRVLLIDAGRQRNLASPQMHGFLSRDGMAPRDFLAVSAEQLASYPAWELLNDEVIACTRSAEGFVVTTATGIVEQCRVLLFATGVHDKLPDIIGIEHSYGKQVHHCPYCDGWEHRDQRIVVYGSGEDASDLAWELTAWSAEVTLLTEGESAHRSESFARLKQLGVPVLNAKPVEFQRHEATLVSVVCSNGDVLPCDAFFFSTEERAQTQLPQSLGCKMDGEMPEVNGGYQTSVPGVFVAGNACKGKDMVVMAAAEGAMAAFSINEYLLKGGIRGCRMQE